MENRQYESSFENQQNSIANFKPSALKCRLYCDMFFINKPTFSIFLPQLITKIYCGDTTRFYGFAWVIVAQANISLMTILSLLTLNK